MESDDGVKHNKIITKIAITARAIGGGAVKVFNMVGSSVDIDSSAADVDGK
jgi:hypothetical protein